MRHITKKCRRPLPYPKRKYAKTRHIQNGGGVVDRREFDNGDVYEGDIRNDQMSGQGKMTFANGDVYKGEWDSDTIHGSGTMIYADGERYAGEWEFGKRHGKGKMVYASMAVYQGDWRNGQMSGKGKMTFADGAVYEGDWRNDEMNGQGKMIFDNGSLYEGAWANDDMNGQGKIIYADGNIYEGHMYAGMSDGYGKMTYADGSIYEGQWYGNNRHGEGTMKYEDDGSTYEGDWWNTRMHGDGEMRYADGTVYNGLWRDNAQHPLFNPETGELADNLEYNPQVPVISFSNSDNRLYASNTYSYTDSALDERNVLEDLKSDSDLIALKLNRTYYVVSKPDIIRASNNKNFIKYQCRKFCTDADPNIDVIKSDPYLAINGLFGAQGLVPLRELWAAVNSGHHAYELVKIGQLPGIASHHVVYDYGSWVSSDHCQDRNSNHDPFESQIIDPTGTVYALKKLQIAKAPRRSKKSKKVTRRNKGHYRSGVYKPDHITPIRPSSKRSG
jgi:hypothetical protein